MKKINIRDFLKMDKRAIQAFLNNMKRVVDKYKNQLIVILFATIVILPIIGLLIKNGVFISRDYAFHYGRLNDVLLALKDGQILPQLDPETANGLGFGVLQFYGPTPIYIISLLRLIIPSWIWSMVVFEWMLTCGIALLICNFVIKLSKVKANKLNYSALISSAFILLSGSVITNLYHYISYSGLFSIFCLTLMLINFYSILELGQFGLREKIILTLSAAGLITGHAITMLISIVFISIFMLLNIRKAWRHLPWMIICLLIAAVITSWFTLPLIENLSYPGFNYNNNLFKQSFSWQSGFNMKTVPLRNIIFGQPGIDHIDTVGGFFWIYLILGLFISSYSFFIKKSSNRIFISSSVATSLLTVLFVTKFINWDYIPSIFYTLQYPSRILVLTGIFFTIGLAPFISKIKMEKTAFLVIMAFLSTFFITSLDPKRHNIGGYSFLIDNPEKLAYSNSIDSSEGVDQLAIGEYLTTNMGTCDKGLPNIVETAGPNTYAMQHNSMKCLKKRGFNLIASDPGISISSVSRKGSHYKFTISQKDEYSGLNDYTIELPQAYYLGYRAFGLKEDKRINLVTEESKSGLLQIRIPGNYEGEVRSYYGLSRNSKIGLITSFSGLAITILAILRIVKNKDSRPKSLKSYRD
jgi:hypothetical protein